MNVRIAIAEDNSMALHALKKRLSQFPEIHIKYTASNGRELLDMMHKNSVIDLILMDLQMPEMDGIETTKRIKTLFPQIKVVILTMFDDDEHLFDAIMAGASGYLLKEDDSVKIQQAIHDTLQGGAAMSPSMALKTLKLVRQPLTLGVSNSEFDLTPRELEILTQLKNGLTYEEIASNLLISYHTVRKHIENIYRKLQVSNKTEAVIKAQENRLTE
jgi:DNA-binding NarL/FixJ family response regulator